MWWINRHTHPHLLPLSSARHRSEAIFFGGGATCVASGWVKVCDESGAASQGKTLPRYFFLLCRLVSWQRVVSPCCSFWLDDSIKRPRWFTAHCVFMGTSVCFGLPVCLSASLKLKAFSPDVALESNDVITGEWMLLLFDYLSRGCFCFVRLLNDDLNISLRKVALAHSIVQARCHHFIGSKAFRLFKAKKILRLARVEFCS